MARSGIGDRQRRGWGPSRGGALGTQCRPPEVGGVRARGDKDRQSCFPV